MIREIGARLARFARCVGQRRCCLSPDDRPHGKYGRSPNVRATHYQRSICLRIDLQTPRYDPSVSTWKSNIGHSGRTAANATMRATRPALKGAVLDPTAVRSYPAQRFGNVRRRLWGRMAEAVVTLSQAVRPTGWPELSLLSKAEQCAAGQLAVGREAHLATAG